MTEKEVIPTADDYITINFGDQLGLFSRDDVTSNMIEFAELHVKAAVEAVQQNCRKDDVMSDKKLYTDVYPLSNIK